MEELKPADIVYQGELDYVLALRVLRVHCYINLKDDVPFFEARYATAAQGSKPHISFPLDDSTSIFRSRKETTEFEITYNKVKNYKFRARNKSARAEWIKHLGCHVNEFDVFLSYHQCKATQDTVMSLHYSFEQLGYETFFDKIIDDLNVEKMEKGVAMTRAYLLFLSTGVFSRDAVLLECKTAVKNNKPIITVYDRDSDFSFEKERTSSVYKKFLKEINGTKENPIDILNDVEAEVLERMPKKRQVMISSLLARAGLPDRGNKLTDMQEDNFNTLGVSPLSKEFATGINVADSERVVDWLLGNSDSDPEIKHMSNLGVSGMDGTGKSWFVQTVAWDERVLNKFKDGIYWLQFSYGGDGKVDEQIRTKQAELGKAVLKRKFYDLGEAKSGAQELARILERKDALVILDNIGSTKVLDAFDFVTFASTGVDVRCRTVVTVRDMSLIESRRGFWSLRLKSSLPDDEALKILEKSSGRKYVKSENKGDKDENLHAYAIQIIRRCKSHPMAVGLAGKLINAYGSEVALLEKLMQVNTVYNLEDAKTSVNALMAASLDNLTPEIKRAYWDLAIFAKGFKFTANDAALLWRMHPGAPAAMSKKIIGEDLTTCPDAEYIAKKLCDLSLLSVEDVDVSTLVTSKSTLHTLRKGQIKSVRFYSIHDMQLTYIREEDEREKNGQPPVKDLHALFVKNIYKSCNNEPWKVNRTFHTYILTRLSSHLRLCRDIGALKELVFNYDWLQSKIIDEDFDTTVTYIDDVRRLNEHMQHVEDRNNETATTFLLRTINLSIGIINRHPTNAALAEQIWNRLYPIVSNAHNITGDCMTLLKQLVTRADAERKNEEGLQSITPSLASPEYSLLQSLSGHTGAIKIARTFQKENFSTQIISASTDQTIRIWDVENGRCNVVLGGENSSGTVKHTKAILAIAMYEPSAVDTYIISGGLDGQVIFWNADDGSVKRVMKIPTQGVTSLAVDYASDGDYLYVASDAGSIFVYDIKKAFSSDAEMEPILTIEDDEGMTIYTIALHSPDNPKDGNPLILYGGNRNDMKAYDTKKKKIMHFRGHKSSVNRISIYHPKGWAITGSTDCLIKVWKIKSRRCVKTLGISSPGENHDEGTTSDNSGKDLNGHNQSVRDITIFTDPQRPDKPVLVSVSKDRVVIIWDLLSGNIMSKLFGHSNSIYTVCACKSKRGDVVITGAEDRQLKVWEMGIDGAKGGWRQESTDETRENAFGDIFDHYTHSVYAIKGSPDGKLLVTGTAEGRVRIIDRESTKVLETLKDENRKFHSGRVRGLDVIQKSSNDRNNLLVASGSTDQTVKVWEYNISEQVGGILATLEGHTKEVRATVFRTDVPGQTIFSAGRDCKILKWSNWQNEKNNTKPAVFGEHDDTVFSLVLHTSNKKSKILLSASYDQSVKVWDLEKETCLKVLTGHEGPVRSIAIADCAAVSKAPIIFSASVDTTIKVWDYTRKIPLIDTLKDRMGAVRAVDVVGDGQGSVFVFAGSEDRNVKVWDLDVCKKIASKKKERKSQQRRSITNDLEVDVKIIYSLSATLGRLDHPLYCGSIHTIECIKEDDDIFVMVGASAGGIPQLKLSLG